MIERVGRWDCTRLGVLINPEKSPGGQERLIRGHILACEQLLQACEADERRRGQQQPEAAKREQPLTQVVVVMDLAGLGSGHMNRRLINCFQTINAIELGMYSPSLEVAVRIAAVFEAGIDDVFSYGKENQ